MLCPVNKFTKALEFIEDGIGGGGPGKRAVVAIVMAHVVVDVAHQLAHTAERPAPNSPLGDEREPALDLVEPARVPAQPRCGSDGAAR